MRLILPLLAMLSAPAAACAVAEDFSVADVARGPVVVVAEVTDYRVGNQGGRLTLDVAEVWKGNAPHHLTVRWGIAMADQPPEAWDERPRKVIAALSPDGQGFDLVVRICGSAHLVPDTPANRREIRAALAP